MARFARDRRLVEAIVDGVAAMLDAHGSYDSHDLIDWLNANRPAQLHDLYDLYHDCADPEMTADQQIGKFLETLGQIKLGEQVAARPIEQRGGGDRNGTSKVSVWEASEQARQALEPAKESLFGPGGFFERIARERSPAAPADWLHRVSGSMKEIPEEEWQEFLRYSREAREEMDREHADVDRP